MSRRFNKLRAEYNMLIYALDKYLLTSMISALTKTDKKSQPSLVALTFSSGDADVIRMGKCIV